MGHKKSIGLPGGPNEFLQDITQYISIEGYKNDSSDKNNPVNIIESSNITMEGVDFPVRGYGNNGMVQDMIPGVENYDYGNADYVVEIPMAQDGWFNDGEEKEEELIPNLTDEQKRIKEYNINYYESDKFKTRLKNMHEDYPSTFYLDKTKKERDNLLETNPRKSRVLDRMVSDMENNTGYYKPLDVDSVSKRALKKLKTSNVVTYNDEEDSHAGFPINLNLTQTGGITGQIDPTKPFNPDEVFSHELVHNVPVPYTERFEDVVSSKMTGALEEHDEDVEETRADVGGLRYFLNKAGINDGSKEDFTPEHLKKASEKLKDNDLFNRLRTIYSNDEDFIWIMNKMASTNNLDSQTSNISIAQDGTEVPKRKGVRKNPDGSESTHLMATETLDGKNWFSFPTLFQDPDGTWIDMSDKPWKEAYEEAEKRGELIDFGIDKESAIKFGEGSWKPKAQNGDETSSDLEKEIDGLDLSKYNVRVIQYPYGSKKFSPGHIESVLIDKKTGKQVNKISGTKLVGYINRWAGPGNRRVTQRDYEQEEDVRTVDLNLSDSEIKNFITEAQLFTGTNKGKEHSKSGLNVRKLPLSINDDNIYDYDFVDSNCATGVCMGLGMDPNSPENTQAGITDPNLVMDGILSKYNDFIVPGSSTGYRTSREEGLRNLVKDNLGKNVNAGTIDVLTNYLDGLNRDDINNTLESILQNPTALKILKDDGDLSKIGDRAFRDLTSLFNANFNPFVDVGRGREEMAKSRLKKIQRDVSNMYESIPEGTIPAALEAINEQYVKPNNPFDVSLEGIKNIPSYWKNKLGFKEGGSTTNPYTIYMNYINGIDESEVAQNIFDKLNRIHYKDAKTRGMGVANYIASNIIPNS